MGRGGYDTTGVPKPQEPPKLYPEPWIYSRVHRRQPPQLSESACRRKEPDHAPADPIQRLTFRLVDRRLYALLEVKEVARKVVQRYHAYTKTRPLWQKRGQSAGEEQSDRFIIYGSLSYRRWNEDWEWEIQAVDLETGKAMFEPSIKLSNCDGSVIGNEVCFEMRNSHLYAVFNTPLKDTQGEINWTSFYHCIRISAADSKKTMWRMLWRRQDEEGPIDDRWTHLSLDINEVTGNLVLNECRREYLGGRSENSRTAYYSAGHPSQAGKW
ncbi:uncharacterized protein CIMG_03733 [Coccidioides immitis RS]|uniref:Uncharacterized protein n=1 Tax=Coccidioides immitis (strain RS) TaxID=246410 RepID=J3KC03_COCIM|nr:uncharacterized protein CIMG_03733 [Coccidioides immitis RS]EAS32709.3 hypothetical protein CIMG_03733 [Coccidioides immitis RS]